MEKGNKPVSVDEYIESAPESVRPMLKGLRKAIKTSAPKSVEGISYGMPYYSYHGRLVYFMAHKSHIGFYPMKSAIAKFSEELKEYKTAIGTVQFPIGKPLPLDLIKKMIFFRLSENEMAESLKKSKKK
jgi:uncharacterized protein YdhG (YjbR/CyaY superfamily)